MQVQMVSFNRLLFFIKELSNQIQCIVTKCMNNVKYQMSNVKYRSGLKGLITKPRVKSPQPQM